MTVKFTFIYADTKHLKHIYRMIESNTIFFTYHYLKQLQHVIRKHTTAAHTSMLLRICGNKPNPYQLIEFVNTMVVNHTIHELFDISPLKAYWKDLSKQIPLQQSDSNITEFELIKEYNYLGDVEPQSLTPELDIVQFEDLNYIVPHKYEFMDTSSVMEQDQQFSNLSNSIFDSISTSTKGTAVGDIFKLAFESVQIDVSWFDKLKSSLDRTVYYQTSDHYPSWTNLSNTYRHIFNSPVHQHVEHKLNLIVSIDQSGSMHTEDLQKLLHIFTTHSKKIASCTVLIHTSDIIRKFNLSDDFDITNHPDFINAFSVRYANGGTSHRCIFNYIQSDKLIDPDKSIYISLSDNYSDIEQSIKEYPVMRRLSKYWITASQGRPVDVEVTGGIIVNLP